VFADRFDRRLAMVICDVIRFALFASIPAVGLLADAGQTLTWALTATFLIEAVALFWIPAKEAAVPNLVPKHRLEVANQLSLITTYGVTPVVAAGLLAVLTRSFDALFGDGVTTFVVGPVDIALWANAVTFLAAAVVVYGTRDISRRDSETSTDPPAAARVRQPGLGRQLADGFRFVRVSPLVGGLVQGILGAFAVGGVVVGTGTFYAQSLGGGEATFSLLFGILFIGLGAGMAIGPKLVGGLSRRRWFGMSIVLSGAALVGLALAPHLAVALPAAFLVGAGAGMAYLAGMTLLGGEVDDAVRGRTFAFVQSMVRVVLMLSIAVTSVLVGFGGSHQVEVGPILLTLDTVRLLLIIGGAIGMFTGVLAFRRMDDRTGVSVIGDLIASVRGQLLSRPDLTARTGLFVALEGGEGAGKSTQAIKLAAWLKVMGHEYVLTREPGATDVGAQIRSMLLDPSTQIGPRAEALLYASDRAHHVASVIRPALERGAVVVSDRYVDSSLAYQGAGRSLPLDEVGWLSDWATGGLRPDLVVVLDVSREVSRERISGRAADRLEAESDEFHDRVRQGFLDLAEAHPSRYLVVDAADDPEAIAQQIRDRVGTLLEDMPAATPEVAEEITVRAEYLLDERVPVAAGVRVGVSPSGTAPSDVDELADRVTEPVAEPAADPVLDRAAEPVVEPAAEPVAEPVVEPVIDPVADTVPNAIPEPITEPITEPVTEPITEPITEQPAAETKPARKPSPRPKAGGRSGSRAKAATKPASKSTGKSASKSAAKASRSEPEADGSS
jgi:dTMP kinase